MMNGYSTKIPKGYTPYPEIEICSNKLIGVGNIILIKNIVPLYIGVGDIPKIWLKAISDIKNKTFVDVVEDSISKHPAIKINSNNSEIIIKIEDIVILETSGNSKKRIRVVKLDLRPLGMNIYGDKNVLHAGNSNFSNNTFSGTGTFLALG